MVVMARVLILLALLQTTLGDGPKSHYRVYRSLYCPLKTEWKWSAKLWELDGYGLLEADKIYCREGSGSAQFVTYFMEGDIDDGNDKAEFEVVIRHTCHTDGRRRKFKGEDAKVDIAHGDSYLFKAI